MKFDQALSMRRHWYIQIALDALALLVFFLLKSSAALIVLLLLFIFSMGNANLLGNSFLSDLKRCVPDEEYQQIAAQYFPYGSLSWVGTMLQWRKFHERMGEQGRMLLFVWMRLTGVAVASALVTAVLTLLHVYYTQGV